MGQSICGRNAINGQIKKHMKVTKSKIQVLFLGAGESGKSTIIRHATVIHGEGFSASKRTEYIKKITRNLIYGAQQVFLASAKVGNPIQNKDVLEAGERLSDLLQGQDPSNRGVGEPDCLTDQIVGDLHLLWQDSQIQATMTQSARFQLEDTWPVLMKKLENYPTWGGTGWLPSDDDILLSRVRTVGMYATEVKVDNQLFSLIDVGGQRNERKKWLSLFRDVDGVAFVASLSEYNQTLFEAETINRLTESLLLFRQYGSHNDFKDSTVMLFLNKLDLFQEKYYVRKIPLVNPLPDYKEEPPLVENEADIGCALALTWFTELYVHQLEGKRSQEDVFPHVITALDRTVMQTALDACLQFILQRTLLEF